MPELPEVETFCQHLNRRLKPGEEITGVKVFRRDLRFPVEKGFSRRLRSRQLAGISRRAKYLLWDLGDITLLSHLGMSGHWRFIVNKERRLHDHVHLEFSNGQQLAFNDPRRFGFLLLTDTELLEKHPRLNHLGPEPLGPKRATADYFFKKSRGKKVSIKNFLMDQRVVVGVGNIYVCEALFRAGIRPTRRAERVSGREWQNTTNCVQDTLREAIAAGGSSISDFRSPDGKTGYFQHQFQVYGRENHSCVVCKAKIRCTKQAGRSSFWCPQCQK